MIAALICCLLTIAVVVLEKIGMQTFPQLVMLIQISFTIITIGCLWFPFYYDLEMWCRTLGYIEYSLWIVMHLLTKISFLLTLLLLIIIERRMKADTKMLATIHRKWKWIIAGCFVVPLILNMIPFDKYSKCGLGEYLYFCSLCSKQITFLVVEVSTTVLILLPAAYLFYSIRKSTKGYLTDEQKLSLEVARIPRASFIILTLNLLTKLIDYGVETWLFWLYVMVNLLFYTVPMLNLYLFVRFMKGYPISI